MRIRVTLWSVVVTCALLVALSPASALAQAQAEQDGGSPEPDGSSGLEQVALCEMPELGEPVGSSSRLIASIADVPIAGSTRAFGVEAPSPGDLGCRFPDGPVQDPFTGREQQAFQYPGSRPFGGTSTEAPILTGVAVFSEELSKKDLAAIGGDPRVATVGNLKKVKPGTFRVVIVDHRRLPDDAGINVFMDLDGKPTNNVPLGSTNPTSPLAGVDGGWTVFGGDQGPRIFSTEFGRGNEYYTGKRPAATIMTKEQTALLIQDKGGGETFHVFTNVGGAFHTAGDGWLPNGALPWSGRLSIPVGCISQDVLHDQLVVNEAPVSASTDWISGCFILRDPEATVDALTRVAGPPAEYGLVESLGWEWGVTFGSRDPGSRKPRDQQVPAQLEVVGAALYVRFPAGLLRYGPFSVEAVRFAASGDAEFDALMAALGETLDTFLFPIQVGEGAGLGQGGIACRQRGAQQLQFDTRSNER